MTSTTLTKEMQIMTKTNKRPKRPKQPTTVGFITKDPVLIQNFLETQDLVSQELGMKVTRPQLLGHLLKHYLQEK